ncbi:PIN domain-containing protein [Microvirga sp. Mcv34]|uniref:PIN domain-containing protein n=1 Tax=Microvirga sp. Mcv34 TaxID=2926016 RepID=UPI0021CADE82|nr:PIN domain-containing protein [Microvirga sp. Mcv34]
MRYLLDTNAMIELLKGTTSHLAQRARREDPRQVGFSSIVAHELYYGAYKSRRRVENLERLDAIRFEVLPFDKEDAMAHAWHAGHGDRRPHAGRHAHHELDAGDAHAARHEHHGTAAVSLARQKAAPNRGSDAHDWDCFAVLNDPGLSGVELPDRPNRNVRLVRSRQERSMRKTALLATALVFAATNLALALPAPIAAGQAGIAASDGLLTPVRDNKKAKKAKTKKSSKSGGGMNMQGMPPGHKM